MQTTRQNPDPGNPLEVLVVGEAIMDIVVSPQGSVAYPGGSPTNVAYGLGRLGVETALLTSIGDDPRGTAIEQHLNGAGVALLPGSRRPGRTATATATLADDGSAHYDFDIYWALPATAPATLPKILHTGSIATLLAPGAAAVKELLLQSHQRCLVTYDPNIRPALLGSHAEAKSIFEELVPLTAVVKLSDEDAQWLYPDLQLDDVPRHILGLGARLVAITVGSRGSLLATGQAHAVVPAVQSTVADTIGAGDSYMSALIHGLLHRGNEGFSAAALAPLGQAAAKAAAITVRRAGANPPTLAELHMDLPEQEALVQ
ncbi:PfkB family carbohydrate kinase [Paenarthrobacter ureafaciens]|uniref:PfkB family carbohydrate kinase n=1 Tax=Paenarthrobacter ureafaciens TaxID=37931 RepID=UPI001917A107|nr:PfkB family carbohydrate kinase [Paenarthrobacter ureafaciens]QQQ62119.1 carbohydrate kinase [Paenarthrobacter ureafaciens]